MSKKQTSLIAYQEVEIKINQYKRIAILVRHTTDESPETLPLDLHYEYTIRDFRPDYSPFKAVLIPRLCETAGLTHFGQLHYGLLTFERVGK